MWIIILALSHAMYSTQVYYLLGIMQAVVRLSLDGTITIRGHRRSEVHAHALLIGGSEVLQTCPLRASLLAAYKARRH